MVVRNSFISAGLPVVIFCVGGMIGLTQIVRGRKEIDDMNSGRKTFTTREYDIKEDFKKTMEKLKIDDYELIRVKRPDEE